MGNELKDAAEKFLSGSDGRRISEKRGDLERIASSRDGEAVRGMLERGGFERAVERGDTEAVKSAVSEVLKTEAGARLIEQLRGIMGK